VSVVKDYDPVEELKKGNLHDADGMSNLDAVAACGRLTGEVWDAAQLAIEETMQEEEQFDYDQIGYG
jgi:hypothetical protein